MKFLFLTTLFCFAFAASRSQSIQLSDSVIYIDNKPVALYNKTVNESMPHYDMDVYGIKGNLLIQATVIKFNAPVAELKPFYYYEIIFNELKDTTAVYVEDEAFPIVFAKIIAQYKLISDDKIDKGGVLKFKQHYPGFINLAAKIKYYKDYLIETRRLDEQVVRDRSKPVTIYNDRIIMQDGVKIGTIREEENLITKDYFTGTPQYTNYGTTYNNVVTNVNTKKYLQAYFVNGSKVDFQKKYTEGQVSKQKEETGYSLYEISKPATIAPNSFADQLLKRVCFLIEEYAL